MHNQSYKFEENDWILINITFIIFSDYYTIMYLYKNKYFNWLTSYDRNNKTIPEGKILFYTKKKTRGRCSSSGITKL